MQNYKIWMRKYSLVRLVVLMQSVAQENFDQNRYQFFHSKKIIRTKFQIKWNNRKRQNQS